MTPDVRIVNPATLGWEAVYYPNPIPLSSRSLLLLALLFDRVHLPGVIIPRKVYTGSEKAAIRRWTPSDPEQQAYKNLCLWSAEQPQLWDFLVFPDRFDPSQHRKPWTLETLSMGGGQLLDATYGEGTSERSVSGAAVQALYGGSESGYALTWPLYQVRALEYAKENSLPLLSDDPLCIPPFPRHPGTSATPAALAQQLAIQALSLTLPRMRSVDPSAIVEFRGEVQPLVEPFRREMVKMTADLAAAIAAGGNDVDLIALSRGAAESRVLPALQDLAKQIKDPVKPFHKFVIDVGEAAVATVSSAVHPALTVGWALIRGAKIAVEYVQLYKDREGKRKSGLSYLLNARGHFAAEPEADLSEWDKNDWRCSGLIDVPELGFPLTSDNQLLVEALPKGFVYYTVRRLFQTRTMSFVKFGPSHLAETDAKRGRARPDDPPTP